ncbi:transcriptional regulator, XRE family [Citreicella sp. SE45]|uniref:Transcriptional regulator, contains XRE-family HTH domain n=1 Tax=Salipiger thiooxidans TaxID=282683 RepID=A0A1G7FIP4_9RHOB|nr:MULTISPECIES: helix-turn-helix transcriptional regulator [Salipiger]EEX11629.1 transcriptional regulator, XRE family [Citreicella sp. SE45]MAU48398.1 XRE family transcriptional regulator [Salipiger sp.]NVK61956.1 helix-turn-helix transcriptional regulator [Paracoccaceae bacterium]NIY94690.1 helix-turn-helix transcriptional regulator [Salipiger sp. HF18]SDE75780.1 Transcriptional regulator, contains XRE-family HTH domain [Salipiger thiooxidans]
MTLRYDEIGQRLRAFRLGSGMSAEEVANRIGISRTAVYRFEKGEVVKIETLIGLAELLNVSLPTLLGVEIEYISSAVTYFERLRQLETEANQIIVLAGPISYLLASDDFHESLERLLKESVPETADHRDQTLADIERIIEILKERKANYLSRRPTIVNLMSAHDIVRLLRSGFVGQPFLPPDDLSERRARARREVQHFIDLIEGEPIGVQVGLVTGTLPHSAFQIFRKGDVKTLSISPFRLGEQPNVRLGVAMITNTDEAIALHERTIDQMWRESLKGREAADYLRKLLETVDRENGITPDGQ